MRWFNRMWNSLPDLDELMAYDTVKEVRVLDRRLGVLYYSTALCIFFYIVIWVFMMKQQYLEEDKSNGWMITKVMNPTLTDAGLPYDLYDSITNPGEQGSLFLPTRVLTTKEQTQDWCQSPTNPCSQDSDCDIGNEKLQKSQCDGGFCVRFQWCPAEDETKETTTVSYINATEYQIWFQTHLHFHRFSLDVLTTDYPKPVLYPMENATTYYLKDLLRQANLLDDKQNMKKTVTDNGAIMLVNALFRCSFEIAPGGGGSCDPNVESMSIDASTGFNYLHTSAYFKDGQKKRMQRRLFGVRISAASTGYGSKTSLSQIVLQVSSAIALMTVATSVTDFVLQYVVPERRHYYEQKIIQADKVYA